jgi:hypothetical protein
MPKVPHLDTDLFGKFRERVLHMEQARQTGSLSL